MDFLISTGRSASNGDALPAHVFVYAGDSRENDQTRFKPAPDGGHRGGIGAGKAEASPQCPRSRLAPTTAGPKRTRRQRTRHIAHRDVSGERQRLPEVIARS